MPSGPRKCTGSAFRRLGVHGAPRLGPSPPRPHPEPYEHRGALRGTPGSAFPEYEPNATELPLSCPVAPPSQHPAPRPSRAAWAAARVCWAWGFPPLEDADERLGTMSTVTRPSWHRTRPPPRPAPSPTPRPSRARPSRVAQGQRWGRRACAGPGVSRRWKMSMNDAARRAPSRVLRGTEHALRRVLC